MRGSVTGRVPAHAPRFRLYSTNSRPLSEPTLRYTTQRSVTSALNATTVSVARPGRMDRSALRAPPRHLRLTLSLIERTVIDESVTVPGPAVGGASGLVGNGFAARHSHPPGFLP